MVPSCSCKQQQRNAEFLLLVLPLLVKIGFDYGVNVCQRLVLVARHMPLLSLKKLKAVMCPDDHVDLNGIEISS